MNKVIECAVSVLITIVPIAILVLGMGAMLHGKHTDIAPAGSGCYTVTTEYTHWYPSPDEVLSRKLICKGK